MGRRPRRNHSSDFQAKVALAVIRGGKTISELTEQFDDHPSGEKAGAAAPPIDVKSLYAKIVSRR